MHGWQANKKGTCALPVKFRAMPENEKPPAMRVDIYYLTFFTASFLFKTIFANWHLPLDELLQMM